MIRKSILVSLIFMAFFAGSRVNAAGGEGLFFPGGNIVLRDGDILLTYVPSLLNSCNRMFAKPEGKYAHALLYIEFPGKGGRLVDFSADGLTADEVKDHLVKLRAVALVRARVLPEKGKLAAAFEDMKRRYDAGKLKFDFSLRWTDNEDGRYYCTEFISHLFRQSGLSDPFPLWKFPVDDFWVRWYSEHLDIDYRRIVSPNAPLYLPDFELVAEYQNKDPAAERNELILDAIFARIGHYLREDEMEIRGPSLGSRFIVNLAGLGLFGGPLVRGLPRKSRTVFIILKEYVLTVASRVERTISLHKDEDWTAEDISALTRCISDAMRDRYFIHLRGKSRVSTRGGNSALLNKFFRQLTEPAAG